MDVGWSCSYCGKVYSTIHDFVMLKPITKTPAPRAAVEQTSQMLKRVLDY